MRGGSCSPRRIRSAEPRIGQGRAPPTAPRPESRIVREFNICMHSMYNLGGTWLHTMLRIDLASRVPVYEQIANGLRAELVSGRFSPGAKLPTVRILAINLGVHHNTVAEAYRQLANEGWLELSAFRHHYEDGPSSFQMVLRRWVFAGPVRQGSLPRSGRR